MALYFFNVRNSAHLPDETGAEFATLELAKAQAVLFAGELLREMGPGLWRGEDWGVEVTDREGLVLFSVAITAQDEPIRRKDAMPALTAS